MLSFTFRKLTLDDLPLIRRWLNCSHVRAWRTDAEREIALMMQDIDNPQIDMRLVEMAGLQIGYIHDHDAQVFHMPQFGDLPPGTRVIDTFVGDPDYIGQGHAAAFVADRMAELGRDYQMTAVAPNTTDSRAIAIYTQAGFRKRRLATTRQGKLVQVMTHR